MGTKINEMNPNNLTIEEGLKMEQEKAYGTGNFLVKLWFHNDYFHLADFVQAFNSASDAKLACEFLKKCNGIEACYLVRIQPYKLLERIIKFK